MNLKTNDIIISTPEELSKLHNNYYHNILNDIPFDIIHFKDINFNYLEDKILAKLSFKIIKFENCVLGKLYNFRERFNEIHLINQKIDSYSKQYITRCNKYHLSDIDLGSLELFFNYTSFKFVSLNKININDNFNLIKNSKIDELIVNDINIEDLTINDLNYLYEKMDKYIKKLIVSGIEIKSNNIISLIRKLKIKNLLVC